MNERQARRARSQGGFTLIELIIASAMGLVVMSALTSVVFTTYQADQMATSRVNAAGQIRSFQQTAYGDFATSSVPTTPGGCGTLAQPCAQGQAIILHGCAWVSNPALPDGGSWQARTVTYGWDSTAQVVNRTVSPAPPHVSATGVPALSWYVDSAAGQTVVVTITATAGTYSQSQTMRFYPRVVSQLPNYVGPSC